MCSGLGSENRQYIHIYTYTHSTYLGTYILAPTTRNICASMSDRRFNNIIIMIMHPREIFPWCYAHAYDTTLLMTAMSPHPVDGQNLDKNRNLIVMLENLLSCWHTLRTHVSNRSVVAPYIRVHLQG